MNLRPMRRCFFLIRFCFLLLAGVGIPTCCVKESPRDVQALSDLEPWINPAYTIDSEALYGRLREQARALSAGMYADAYARTYYNRATEYPLIWVTRAGVDERADSLLTCLRETESEGLAPGQFRVAEMQTLLDSARAYAYAEQDATTTLAKLEFLLTQAYLRYVCGQRYGYVRPARLFNRLLVDKPAPGEVHREVQFRALYDHRSEEATDSFATHALEEARHRRMGDFLREIQPSGKLYDALKTEYQRARTQGDTVRQRLARLNLERARWRYPRPEEGRYVWVNLAGQQLTAVDTRRDTAFTMKVCCGNDAHKTPLLHSEIYRVELNPYWVIPQTIVRKEIVPRHVGDSAYFARNRYTAIDKDTRRKVDPAMLTAGQLRSAQYILRQEKGADNSLGRIIFRFANDFSIFLHDTNNHGAFRARNRAISHGCVRVERPLDLALFMLDEPTPLFVDRIRMAIDLPPLSTEGERYRQENPEAKPLGSFAPSESVPVLLDYWTLYPYGEGTMQSYPDSYGYDEVLEQALTAF